MLSFNNFLQEKLITFGGRAYPRFGQVVILAGGAGSGKGFQLENLLGIEGKVFDVDALKKLAQRSVKFAERVRQETGQDINNFNLRVPENVSKLHEILADVYNLPKRQQHPFFASVLTSPADRKPNIIFDVTLKDLRKLESITRNVADLGYDKRNVHIVWVVNHIDVAIEQNKTRDRVVPGEILLDTHRGASLTMKQILSMGDTLKKYMDGDIWLTFNQVNIDTKFEITDKDGKAIPGPHGGNYIKEADYVRVKQSGKAQTSPDQLEDRIYNKIKSYVPEIDSW